MKKFLKPFLFIISFVITVYIVQCLYLSFKVDKILKASYDSYGEVNIYPDDISDEYFNLMSYRNIENKAYSKIYEENWRSFPITILSFDKAYSWYWYDYKSAMRKGKTEVPVTVVLELKNFRWVITGVYERS